MPSLKTFFVYPEFLWAMMILPVIGLISLWTGARRRRALMLFAGPGTALLGRRFHGWRGFFRRLFLLFGLSLTVVGSAGPRWGLEPEQTTPGRDLIVALDCSRSMLAEQPTRLERARRALIDLTDALHTHGGHRIALVAYAARARILCPLTRDYDHFREVLANVLGPQEDAVGLARRIEALDLGPVSGDVSGTRIGMGIDMAVQARDPRFPGMADVLLLSDGDDPALDRDWYAAAARARARGVPVYPVGLGDPASDSVLEKSLLRPDELPFKTRLNEAPLQEIAEVTQGRYIAARDTAIALGPLYFELIASQALRDDGEDSLVGLQPRYVWFLLPAFVLLALTLAMGQGKVRP